VLRAFEGPAPEEPRGEGDAESARDAEAEREALAEEEGRRDAHRNGSGSGIRA
jgi:hypothetical protein